MIDRIRQLIIDFLATIWRSFGSPRIAGDEKAVSSIKKAWSKRERAIEKGTSLTARTRNIIIGASGLVVAAILIWLIISIYGGGDDLSSSSGLATPTPLTGPEFLTEVSALSLAVVAARDNGLVSQDFEHIARRVSFGEYAQAIGELNRADRGLLETSSETEIWAIAFAGDVQLELSNGERVDYDNLTVLVDALTGQIFRVEAFYGEYESEARAPIWLRPPTPEPDAGN
jgi:hypothetical protein